MTKGFWVTACGMAIAACASASMPSPNADAGTQTPDASVPDASVPTSVDLLAVFDLPRMTSTQGLSGTWFDPSTRILWALQDTAPSLVPLQASEDSTSFTVLTPTVLTGRPNPAWDGEALARNGDEFYALTIETQPLLERFDATGAYLGPIDIPAHYSLQPPNDKGVESVTVSPSGTFLFLCNEAALTIDGAVPPKTAGTTVRILRRELASHTDEEHAYRTEPLGPGGAGDMGVSDMLALSDTDLLVMERGYQADYGNTVRIFRVDYSQGVDVSQVPALDAGTPVLPKTLLIDILTLPSDGGVTNPGLQPNPVLENYEGLALGPLLADGRRVLFVTSDDNARATQVPRVLVLAITGL